MNRGVSQPRKSRALVFQSPIDWVQYVNYELLYLFFFQHILSDKISYPDETFMDTEFKISVMYDIAKVLFVFVCMSFF